jgi:hypothetical protein
MRLAAFILAVAAFAASASGGTFYFATNGNDAADGLSWATAKKDAQGFVLALTNSTGDSVVLSNGVWQMTNAPMLVGNNVRILGDARNAVLKGAPGCPVIANTGTNVLLGGLTITGGSNNFGGGGVWGGNALSPSAELKNTVI